MLYLPHAGELPVHCPDSWQVSMFVPFSVAPTSHVNAAEVWVPLVDSVKLPSVGTANGAQSPCLQHTFCTCFGNLKVQSINCSLVFLLIISKLHLLERNTEYCYCHYNKRTHINVLASNKKLILELETPVIRFSNNYPDHFYKKQW